MPTEAIIQEWEAALVHLIAAHEHLKAYLGKPGEEAARRHYNKALNAYEKAAENLE